MATGILKYPYSCMAPPSVQTGTTVNPKADDFDIKHISEEVYYGKRSQSFDGEGS